jgi:hypothetical protein
MGAAGERWGFDGSDRYAHAGMLRVAATLREELEASRLLHKLCRGADDGEEEVPRSSLAQESARMAGAARVLICAVAFLGCDAGFPASVNRPLARGRCCHLAVDDAAPGLPVDQVLCLWCARCSNRCPHRPRCVGWSSGCCIMAMMTVLT